MAVSTTSLGAAERVEAAHTEQVLARARARGQLLAGPPAQLPGRPQPAQESPQAWARVQRAVVPLLAVGPVGKPPRPAPKLKPRRASTRARPNPRAKSQSDKPCGEG